MASEDPCYEIVEGEALEQGDFIISLPAFMPEYSSTIINQLSTYREAVRSIPGALYRYNVVIMSHSCDLEQGKLKHVLVCPYWSLTGLGQKEKKFLEPRLQEEIRRGNMPGYHMLNECFLDEKKQGIQVVEFRST